MTVYGDLYFLLNAGVDLVLLAVAGRLARVRAPFWRLLLAAAAGACYATAELWITQAWIYGLVGRVLASFAMLALAFAPVPFGRFLRLCGYLYAGAAFVAGVTLAVSFARVEGWTSAGAAAVGRSAIPWWALAMGLAGAWLASRSWRARHAARTPSLVGLRVFVGGTAAACRGLVDTGNRLVDPLGSGPVVVVEAAVLNGILPPEVAAALDDVAAVALAAGGSGWDRRLRLIPFQALGTDEGLLVGFRPDRLDVAGHDAEAVTVGITPRRLDPEGEYQALVPACLVAGRGE